MADLLADSGTLDHEQADFTQNIQRSANSLLTVINDILDFSKIESGRLDIEEVQFSLGVVLQDVSKMLSFAAEKKSLRFLCDIRLGETNDVVLLGDPGRIRQILTNLLTNSIKFTSRGHVKMSVHIEHETAESMTISFRVEDTGIGIDDEVKKRLFRPFSQADSSTARRFGGTGLGLTISKNVSSFDSFVHFHPADQPKLVDLLKGTISLESKLDQGTIASFSIPFNKPQFASTGTSSPLLDLGGLPPRLQSEPSISRSTHDSSQGGPAASASSSPPLRSPHDASEKDAHQRSVPPPGQHALVARAESAPAFDRSTYHILVVEDNAINQQIALKTLRNLGFSVTAVWNGKEALDYLMKAIDQTDDGHVHEPKLPSLILMDVQMPVLDGYKATHMLRHHAPYRSIKRIQDIPIIAMTASAIQGDREKCERAGMNDYLAKPVKRPTLETMIMKWIDHQGRAAEINAQCVDNKDIEERPDYARSTTAHSSNCPDYGRRPSTPRALPAMSTIGSPPDATRPNFTSVSPRQMILSDPNSISVDDNGRETLSARVLRRAEAKERASSLRDAKLIAATEVGDKRVLGRPASEMTLGFSGTPMREAYPDQRGSHHEMLALTEENVGRLNAGTAGEPAVEGRPQVGLVEQDRSPSLLPTLPNSEAPSGDRDMRPFSLRAATPDSLDAALRDLDTSPPSEIVTSAPSPSSSTRGQLRMLDRKASDWSTSTAKPARSD